MISEAARQAGAKALHQLDGLLAQRPHEVHAALSEAIRGIIAIRDDLIRLRREAAGAPEVRSRLNDANVLVSIAVSAEFPVTGLHWDRIEKTRDLLRDLLAQR